MKKRILLLASEQPMANLLVACEPSLNVGEAHLLVTGEMHVDGVGDRLIRLLEARGIACRWHDVSEPFQPEPCRERAASLLSDAPQDWFVNVTGGTKPMAIGAYRAAIDAGVAGVVYLDHDQGLIRWMDQGKQAALPINAQLSVSEVVQAHGYVSKKGTLPSAGRIEFAWHMFSELDPEERKALHTLMTKVEDICRRGRNWTPTEVSVPPNRAVEEVLHMACKRQMCDFNGSKIVIRNRDDHQFLAGGWFEVVVADTLKRAVLENGADCQIGLEVMTGDGLSNEVDVAAMIGRRLLLVECKAGSNWSNDKPANVSYKLAHLRRLGGLETILSLASIETLDGNACKRMTDSGISVIDGLTPENIEDKLLAFVNKR